METVTVERLYEEIDRLIERYRLDATAVEALEAVKWWVQEETVPPAG